ncbi:hypothetical protein [Huintestinicola sp.]|uniref:hypothetical protein n=1 Tax=Huintestinicola sp. TaxID=2981661 RepID=UPI003D7C9D40
MTDEFDMLKVLDVFPIGNMLSVTLEGSCDSLKNGSKLVDSNGNSITVVSVAMTRFDDPTDINKSTTVMVDACPLQKGAELSIA